MAVLFTGIFPVVSMVFVLDGEFSDQLFEVIRRLARFIPLGSSSGLVVPFIGKEVRATLLELFAPAVNHRGGQAELAAHLFNGCIALEALQHDFEFRFSAVLFFLCHVLRTFQLSLSAVYFIRYVTKEG